jgi:hypothetical protein
MRYVYRPLQEQIEARRQAAMDVLTAVGLGLCGALFFFFFL